MTDGSRDAQSGVAEVLAGVIDELLAARLQLGTSGRYFTDFGDDPGRLADDLATALEPLLAAERAKAVEAVTREWQFGGWTILTPPPQSGAIPALDLGQRVADWLRDRADREQP